MLLFNKRNGGGGGLQCKCSGLLKPENTKQKQQIKWSKGNGKCLDILFMGYLLLAC